MNWDLVIQEWTLFPSGALEIITDPLVLLFMAAGGLLGMFAGSMPGLTATMTMSLLIGLTLQLPAEAGLAMLIGVYGASIFAGSLTAIMLNIPGTPAAAATVRDGFPLARQGRSREAFGTATWASFFGEINGQIIAFILLPIIGAIALLLGDWEIFLVALIGIMLAGSLGGESPLKGWIAAFVGFLIAMVGTDPIYGVARFGYTQDLQGGIAFLPALIGLFGIAEVLNTLRNRVPYQIEGSGGSAITEWRHFKNVGNVVRSSIIGFGLGLVPGVGESTSPFISYDVARRRSRNPEQFGKGSHEGLIAAETANNATAGGAIVPALILGIPGSGPTAVLIASLLLYGLAPGPTLIIEEPGFIGQIVFLFLLSAVVFRLLAYLLSRYIIWLLSIPREIILPAAACLGFVGAWGAGFTKFDIWIALFFGILGYLMVRRGYPMAPMVIGLLVGPIADLSLRRALATYSNDLSEMLLRPAGLVLLAFLLIMLFLIFRPKGQTSETASSDETEQ